MRVTNSMMVNNLMRNLNRNLIRLDKMQQKLASGKKFVNPSDDPIGVSRSLRLNTEVATMEQHKRNADDVHSWLNTTEMAASNINEILKRAKELTIQAVNETNSINERISIAEEIKELRNQLIQIGNTTYAGSYLFSGFKTDKPLFAADDGSYDIGGGTNRLTLDEVIEVNVGIGDRIGMNCVGQRLFGLYLATADLDSMPADSLTQKQSMTGKYLDLAKNSIDATGGKTFTLTNGTVSEPITITGNFTSLTDLVDYINNQISGTSLDTHVTAAAAGNKLVFESDDLLCITTGTAPEDLDLHLIGMDNNQTSVSRIDSGDKSQIIEVFNRLIDDLNNDDTDEISKALTRIENQSDNVNAIIAEMGVKTNRTELTINRMLDDMVNLKDLLSKNEDADIAEVIMNLKMEEYVYKASLSGGAKIIQPTLVDFIV